ncbi:FAD-dependent oxidoreductase [Mycobacterium helveticum]|uniref:FAD-dependent oxidoreductase n=1 Tax=Mycobacterium helveticum TaxID=2592811 RepID=A0A557XH80_9MYCO|nr:FAD-dependent oxidoreductase [Mycobacterium helveticum]TVS85009.1 FAD-dependent oxidoreductase [Mycobacterium helveticum]
MKSDKSGSEFDLVVIGGGPCGTPAAMTAAMAGARVALIERDRLGGT